MESCCGSMNAHSSRLPQGVSFLPFGYSLILYHLQTITRKFNYLSKKMTQKMIPRSTDRHLKTCRLPAVPIKSPEWLCPELWPRHSRFDLLLVQLAGRQCLGNTPIRPSGKAWEGLGSGLRHLYPCLGTQFQSALVQPAGPGRR